MFPLTTCLSVDQAPWQGGPPLFDPVRQVASGFDAEEKIFMETPRALMPAYDEKGGRNKWAIAPARPSPHKHLHDPVAAAGDGTGMGGDEPLIISMTTLPGRIHQIQATIMSLLEQSVVRQGAPLFNPRQSSVHTTAFALTKIRARSF